MVPNEREHLERLAEIYTGNIYHLEIQVAMAGGMYSVEPKLRNILEQQREELAHVRQRLAQCVGLTRSRPTEQLSDYLQEPSLSKREQMMVMMLLALLEH